MNRLNWILLCSLVVTSFFFFKSCQDNKAELEQTSTLLNAANQKVEYWKGSNGENKARALIFAAEVKVLKEHYGGYFDSLRLEVKGLKKNLSNLEGSIQASTVTERFHLETRLVPDSTGQKFDLKDRWLEIKGTVANDLLRIDTLVSYDSLSFVSYYRSKGFFKGKELVVEATSYNPYSRFTGLKTFNVEEPIQRFSVGPYVGIGIGENFKITPQIGVGVQFSVFRF